MKRNDIEILVKGRAKPLSINFNQREFDCKCEGLCEVTIINRRHVEKLQKLRTMLGKPIKITSAYRCKRHNIKVGGSPRSRHKEGDATDIQVKGVSPQEIAMLAESLGFDGIGIYNTFVHLDSRGYKARWNSVK